MLEMRERIRPEEDIMGAMAEGNGRSTANVYPHCTNTYGQTTRILTASGTSKTELSVFVSEDIFICE